MKDFKVSVVIPAFNEEENVRNIANRLLEVLSPYKDYEIVFVNDGSSDNTLTVLKELHAKNQKIVYLSFSRNFGHQIALKAGIDNASGDCVISMDADLQHPPEMLPQMIEKWQEGFEVVYSIREDDRKAPFFKRCTAKIFYNFLNSISEVKVDTGTADFRLLDRCVVDVIKNMQEPFPFFRGIVPWLGFSQYGIRYKPHERFSGVTKYSFKKMIMLAFNGITSFSTKPLHLSTVLGIVISLISFLYGLYAIGMAIFTDKTVLGWPSVIASVLFIGGIQLLMLGIMGEYLGKLFIESKRRPHYIIKERSKV